MQLVKKCVHWALELILQVKIKPYYNRNYIIDIESYQNKKDKYNRNSI